MLERWPARTLALTDPMGKCQTMVGNIEEGNTGALFSSVVFSPHNKRAMEAGFCGNWAFMPKAESVSCVLST